MARESRAQPRAAQLGWGVCATAGVAPGQIDCRRAARGSLAHETHPGLPQVQSSRLASRQLAAAYCRPAPPPQVGGQCTAARLPRQRLFCSRSCTSSCHRGASSSMGASSWSRHAEAQNTCRLILASWRRRRSWLSSWAAASASRYWRRRQPAVITARLVKVADRAHSMYGCESIVHGEHPPGPARMQHISACMHASGCH